MGKVGKEKKEESEIRHAKKSGENRRFGYRMIIADLL
jgi:hypothetical protein